MQAAFPTLMFPKHKCQTRTLDLGNPDPPFEGTQLGIRHPNSQLMGLKLGSILNITLGMVAEQLRGPAVAGLCATF